MNEAAPRPIRVLHSMPLPGSQTRYASHMAAFDDRYVDSQFFGWRRAIFGRYDIFHLHWPEHLVRSGKGWRGMSTAVLASALVARLRIARTPVVRTVHNLEPHAGDVASNRIVSSVTRSFDRITDVDIHLVPEEPREGAKRSMTILHGGYREPFAAHPRAQADRSQILYFGMIKPYKGIPALLAAFESLGDPTARLRLVGQAVDDGTADEIRAAARSDERVSHDLRFVSDEQLVREVSSSSLVVFPYESLHSSGAVIVALSLDRRVLVPDSPIARALRDEVGADWVSIFGPPLDAEVLAAALRGAPLGDDSGPDLGARAWSAVDAAHRAVYRSMLEDRQRSPARNAVVGVDG